MMEYGKAIMTKNEMLTKFRAAFAAKLETKSGWGKNELLKMFDETLRDLLLEMLEEPQPK